MKRTILTVALIIVIPVEMVVWKILSPFFWQPDIVGTNLAWGHPLLAFVFILIPLGIIGEILDGDDDDNKD